MYLVFRRVRIRGLEQGGSAAVRQQSNQQPSGLLVSPRWSTVGKVYRETAIVYLVFLVHPIVSTTAVSCAR